jgi:1-deoxy-D-xylulose-5-phosphate reductoisomerase
MKPQGIAVLGATGSIGVNTLDVVARHPDRYRVVALSGHRQVDRLFEQACRFLPLYVVVADAAAANALQGRCASRAWLPRCCMARQRWSAWPCPRWMW